MDTWTYEKLLAAEAENSLPKFVFFWGHRAPADGRVGHHVFSQWWPSPFTVDGVHYATAEHFMMASKARLFGDDAAVAAVLAANTPGEAKKEGRKVQGFDEDKWLAHRMDTVVRGSVAKFAPMMPSGAIS